MKAILRIFLFVVVPSTLAFDEYAIFEDEDIYNKALPPVPYTGTIVPGTKWCGPGNISTSYDDLGTFTATDRCCRAHDHCPDVLEPGTTLHGLNNPDIFPRLSCACEQKFLNCLQASDHVVSNLMGRAYFGARSQCFQLAFPAVECLDYQRVVIGRRCIKYKFDIWKPLKWQFFEIPFYTTK